VTNTLLVKDINSTFPGTASSPANLTDVNGTVFFTANDGMHGIELWKSDGTAGGTVMLKDIHLGAGDSSPTNLTDVAGTLFFTANDGIHGIELWKSDGTPTGTVLIKDIYPGAPDASPGSLATVGGTLLFSANDGATGRELWKSRGTAATTVQVQNVATGTGDSDPAGFAVVGPNVFFSATDDTTGDELWFLPIVALNYAPLASGMTVATPLNTPVSGTLNASDPEGSPLTFSIVTNGTKGVAAITNPTTGAFTYTPAPTATGNDTFTFKASDGLAASNVATVTVTIGNHVPVANNATLQTALNTPASGTLIVALPLALSSVIRASPAAPLSLIRPSRCTGSPRLKRPIGAPPWVSASLAPKLKSSKKLAPASRPNDPPAVPVSAVVKSPLTLRFNSSVVLIGSAPGKLLHCISAVAWPPVPFSASARPVGVAATVTLPPWGTTVPVSTVSGAFSGPSGTDSNSARNSVPSPPA